MLIKTVMRYSLALPRMAAIKRQDYKSWWGWSSTTVVGTVYYCSEYWKLYVGSKILKIQLPWHMPIIPTTWEARFWALEPMNMWP